MLLRLDSAFLTVLVNVILVDIAQLIHCYDLDLRCRLRDCVWKAWSPKWPCPEVSVFRKWFDPNGSDFMGICV